MLTRHQILLRFHCNSSPKIDHSVFVFFLSLILLFYFQHNSWSNPAKTLFSSFQVIQDVLPHNISEIYSSPSCSRLSMQTSLLRPWSILRTGLATYTVCSYIYWGPAQNKMQGPLFKFY